MRDHHPPLLLVISGIPGTGKSTLAAELVARRPAVVLSVDPIESAMADAGIPASFERGLAAYLVVAQVAETSLRAGLEVIVDAVSSVEPARALWRGLAARTGARLQVVVCELDEGAQRRRLAERDRGLGAGEPTWADVEARRAEWTDWPEPAIRVSTNAPPAACAAHVLVALEGTPSPATIDP